MIIFERHLHRVGRQALPGPLQRLLLVCEERKVAAGFANLPVDVLRRPGDRDPKAAVFFGSLFSALLPAGVGGGLRATAVAVMVVMTAGWFTIMAALFGLDPVARAYARPRRWIDRVMVAS
ncbi:hypothetical protein [Micromonospora sp. NPDC049679]|uniref:hypothetical protein n=1 Tax=Micromonospora sp. NPDC049679 TaxID=3155920 RepID=UPI0033D37A9D